MKNLVHIAVIGTILVSAAKMALLARSVPIRPTRRGGIRLDQGVLHRGERAVPDESSGPKRRRLGRSWALRAATGKRARRAPGRPVTWMNK